MIRNRMIGLIALAAGALFMAAPTAHAQLGAGISVQPRAGLLLPSDHLFDATAEAGTGAMTRTIAGTEQGAVVGLAIELPVPVPLPMDLRSRIDVLRSVGASTQVQGEIWIPGDTHLEESAYAVSSSLTMVGAHAIATLFRAGPVRPYLLGGLAVKHYGFDMPSPIEAGELLVPENGSSGAIDFGGGIAVSIPRLLDVHVEVKDSYSRFWDTPQHDLWFVAGMAVRMF